MKNVDLFKLFILGCVIAFFFSVGKIGGSAILYCVRMHHFNNLDKLPHSDNSLTDSCKHYISMSVLKDDNIKNKQEVLNRIKNVKLAIDTEGSVKRNAVGYYDYFKSNDYILFMNEKEQDRFTILHELYHLVDIQSENYVNPDYDAVIDKDISFEEYRIKYSLITFGLLNIEDSIKRADELKYVSEIFANNWYIFENSRDYYLSDKEVYVRLNLFKVFLEDLIIKYDIVDSIESFEINDIFLQNIFNGKLLRTLDHFDKDKFLKSDFIYILPALKSDCSDELNLIFL